MDQNMTEQNGEHMVCCHCGNFFFFFFFFWQGGEEAFSGERKTTPHECILRVTRQNGEYCENSVFNTI